MSDAVPGSLSAASAARLSAITAARMRLVIATMLMKVESWDRLLTGVDVANGPAPCTVYQIARMATMQLVVAAPRGPNRTAAQIVTGKIAYT